MVRERLEPKRPGPAEERLGALGRWGGVPLKGDQQQPTALQVSPQQPTARPTPASAQQQRPSSGLAEGGLAGQWARCCCGALELQEGQGAALGLSGAPARWSHWGLSCLFRWWREHNARATAQ
ncbi:hypothetical protein CCMA1212_004447 [Trichoderma ghanense]|uniref:Uncharacterized protein n=1 Tax=Trichoderma ghanense TaxID=65468 RepID=A0ABY2H7V3_9HYPO